MNTGAIEIHEDFWKSEDCKSIIEQITWMESIFKEGYIVTRSSTLSKSWYVGDSCLFETQMVNGKCPIYTISRQNELWRLFRTAREFTL